MILDAFAAIALLRDEPAAAQVGAILKRGPASLTALGLAEALDQLTRVHGVAADSAALDLAELGLDDALPVMAPLGAAAGLLRGRRYHRTRCSVSTADCVAAVMARSLSRPLVTADPHLLDLCVGEDIDYVALPSSTGEQWRPSTP